jgi:hypothetical protein
LTGPAAEHPSRRHPGPSSAAARAAKAVRPPNPLKISGARCLRGEPRVELLNRPRVFHSADGVMAILGHHYILYLRERNG